MPRVQSEVNITKDNFFEVGRKFASAKEEYEKAKQHYEDMKHYLLQCAGDINAES